jgi:hypothetical protein
MRRPVPWLCAPVAAVALLLAGAGESRAERNLEGTWRGTLGQGAGKLRLVLSLARSGRPLRERRSELPLADVIVKFRD